MDTIGKRLKYARKLRRFGARELALLSGLSHNAVSWIEADKSPPTTATVEVLAQVLKVSPGWLAFGEGPEPKETEADLLRQPPRRGRPKKVLPKEEGQPD